MSDLNGSPRPQPEPDPVPPPPTTGPRGHPWLAWIAILLIAASVVLVQNAGRRTARGEDSRQAASLVLFEINMRVWVGGWQALTADKDLPADARHKARNEMLANVEKANRGGLDQRLRAIITLGEIEGPERGREELTKLAALMKEHGREPTPEETNWLDILGRLYEDYAAGRPDAPTVGPEERRELRRAFGWFGDLALLPAPGEAAEENAAREPVIGSARRTFKTATSAALFAVLAMLVGILGLILLGLRVLRGKARSRLGPQAPAHGVYAETFAVWMALFLGMSFIAQVLLHDRLPGVVGGGLAMILSLGALAWPVLRGIPWRQVREDVGLTLGRQPFLEPSYGVLCYFLALGFLPVGVLLTVPLLLRATSVAGGPADPFAPDVTLAHPIIEQFSQGTFRDWIPMLVFGCVVAPVVEELMFRGVLYRHLRDATRPAGGWSVVLAALGVNVLFAVVHPQGLLATFLLTSLACGFVLAREWRGTLVPGMIAHGLNNTLIFTLLIGLSR